MDKNLCRLAILLLSEGTVRIHNNKASIVFTNTSEELNRIFRDSARILGLKTYRKSPKQIAIYNKELALKLLRECRSFRSKPCASGKRNACPATKGKVAVGPSCLKCEQFRHGVKDYPPSSFPSAVMKASNEDIMEYLQIFFTCEGGVVIGSDIRNDEVIVRVGHPILRTQMLELIERTGIEARVRGESLIYIRKRSEMDKFRKMIGFVQGAKSVRGTHRGTEKNRLLDFSLERHGFV